jgi:hypothetical protein
MAQQICAVVNWCPKGKSQWRKSFHWLFPNGAPMAQLAAETTSLAAEQTRTGNQREERK